MGFKNQNHDLFVQKGSIHDLYVHTSPTLIFAQLPTFSFAKAKVEVREGKNKLRKEIDKCKDVRKEASGGVHNDG
jgi:hypothetical protein